MKKREKHHITIRPDIWEAMEAKAAKNGQTASHWLEDLVAYFGLTDKWQGHDKMNYAAKAAEQKTGAATETEKPKKEKRAGKREKAGEDFRDHQEPGTYQEGRAEGREAYISAQARGRTLEDLMEWNADLFQERGEEWRRGFVDQFRELAEDKAEETQTPKAKKGPAKGTAYRTRAEAAEIREAKEKAATAESLKWHAGEISRAEYKKRLAEINKAATEPDEAGQKPSLDEIKKRLDRLLGKPKNEQKAEAKAERQEADRAAADENARIDREIEKAKARAKAGEITAAELKAEIERLNDDRPF